MKVVREGKSALMNWDRSTRILLPQVSALTQNGFKISVAGIEKSPLIPTGIKLQLCVASTGASTWKKGLVCLEFSCGADALCSFCLQSLLLIVLMPGDCLVGANGARGLY